jgi:hypothetical protein
LAGRFDSTIHSTSFSCNVNWGVKNAKDSSWGIQRKRKLWKISGFSSLNYHAKWSCREVGTNRVMSFRLKVAQDPFCK